MLQNRELDLTHPTLPALSHILRNKELWPESFEWQFSFYENCAMGLAKEKWFADEDGFNVYMWREQCDSYKTYHNIFIGGASKADPTAV